jgi:hypothetical protein
MRLQSCKNEGVVMEKEETGRGSIGGTGTGGIRLSWERLMVDGQVREVLKNNLLYWFALSL